MNEMSRDMIQELTGLGETLAELGGRLRKASVLLLNEGLLPAESLAEEILGLRAEYRAIQARVQKLAREQGLTIPAFTSTDSMKAVETIVKQILEAERLNAEARERPSSSRAILQRVLNLKHDRLAEYAPLMACQDKARAILESAAGEETSMIPALESFVSLLALVEDRAGADLEDREAVLRRVEAFFGESLTHAATSGAIGSTQKTFDGKPASRQRTADGFRQMGLGLGIGVGLDESSLASFTQDSFNNGPSWFSGPGQSPRYAFDPYLKPIAFDTHQTPASVARGMIEEVSATPIEEATSEAEEVLAATADVESAVADAKVDEPRPREGRAPRVDRAQMNLRGPSSGGDFFVHRVDPVAGNRLRKLGNAVRRRTNPGIEQLESLRLLACSVISGFIYLDNNNDGLYDKGDTPIANNPVQLYNSSNQLVGSTTSDSTGAYTFNSDSTINTATKTTDETATVTQTTNYTSTLNLPQFNSSLGTLTGVTVSFNGTIDSHIESENTSVSSPDTITASLSGNVALTGTDVSLGTTLSVPPVTATVATYDGTTDYAGPSGHDFGTFSASGSGTKSLSLSGGDDLTPFIGTGNYQATVAANALAEVMGGGNLDNNTMTQSTVNVDVQYQYTPMNCLSPGSYTIVQPTEPAGTLNGRESSGGVVLPYNPTLPNKIPVTLGTTNSTDNDFGQILPSSLAGYVYVDNDNNGIKETGEAPIPGTAVTLTGTDDHGQAVSEGTLTDQNGAYLFSNLRPGTYTLTETQPSAYLDGKDTIGTPGGTTTNDQFSNIVLPSNYTGVNNNFGELQPGGLGGFVYVDANKNGIKDAGETPLSGVAITLSGTNDLGQTVALSTTTDGNGSYSFTGLRPGTYQTAEPQQPAGYLDGQETRGNVTPLPNTVGTDVIPNIPVTAGNFTPNNNFGEYLPGVPNDVTNGGVPLTTIGSVEREGIHHQLTTFIIHFNNGLVPSTAENLAAYHLVRAYHDGEVSPYEIPLKSAVYNSADNTVTLTPVRRVNIHYRYQLTISDSLLSDATPSQPIDGDNNGTAGGVYATVITRGNYPHPLSGPGVIHQSLPVRSEVRARSANPGMARQHLVAMHPLGRGLSL